MPVVAFGSGMLLYLLNLGGFEVGPVMIWMLVVLSGTLERYDLGHTGQDPWNSGVMPPPMAPPGLQLFRKRSNQHPRKALKAQSDQDKKNVRGKTDSYFFVKISEGEFFCWKSNFSMETKG